jgi:hypothetical protein
MGFPPCYNQMTLECQNSSMLSSQHIIVFVFGLFRCFMNYAKTPIFHERLAIMAYVTFPTPCQNGNLAPRKFINTSIGIETSLQSLMLNFLELFPMYFGVDLPITLAYRIQTTHSISFQEDVF